MIFVLSLEWSDFIGLNGEWGGAGVAEQINNSDGEVSQSRGPGPVNHRGVVLLSKCCFVR